MKPNKTLKLAVRKGRNQRRIKESRICFRHRHHKFCQF